MTKQELQERLNKQLEKKAKIEKRLAVLGAKLTEEERKLATTLSWRELRNYEKEFEMDDYQRKNFELRDINETIKNTEEKINKIINFENEDKIEVLVKFLNNWKENAYKWYIYNANEYIELRNNEEQALELAKQDENYYKDFGIKSLFSSGSSYEYHTELKWKAYYYQDITTLTKEIVDYKDNIDTEKLNKVLEDEKVRKYKDLVKRITRVVGTIEDIAGLRIGAKNGEINGLVKGSKATATINTISAGGYNIQCFHYRVLIHEVK